MADFTVAEFLAWARTKPAGGGYDSCSPRHCAVAQFGNATGRRHLVGLSSVRKVVPSAAAFEAIMLSSTFGALVSKLERVVEPSLRKRLWARFTGKTIGQPFVSDAWAKREAYGDTDALVNEVA